MSKKMKGKKGSGGGAAAGAGKWDGDGDGPEAAEVVYYGFAQSSEEDSEEEHRSPAGRKRIGGISLTRKSGGTTGAPSASTTAATSTAAAAGVQGGGCGSSSSSGSTVGGGASGSGGGGRRGGGGGSRGDGGGDKRSEASGGAGRNNKGEEEEEEDDEGAAEGGLSTEENDSSSATSGALPAGDTDLEDDAPVAGGAATGAEEQQPVHDVGGAAAAPAAGGGNNAGVAANNHGESVDLTQSDDGNEEEEEEEGGRGPCPMCGKSFPLAEIDAHANACLDKIPAVPPARAPNAAASRGSGSGGAGGGGSSSPASSAQGAAGNAGGDATGQGACVMCSKLFPLAELQAHANQCLDANIKKDEEEKKKRERAERQKKSKRNRPVVGVLGDISRAESSGSGARSSRVKKEHSNLPAFDDAASASDGGRSAHEDKPGRANNGGGGKRKNRGGGGAAGAGKGAGPVKQHRKAKAEDKKGKGKGKTRDVPTGAGAGPCMFKCPKKVLRQRTGGCGAFNLESDQMCSVCDLHLWESIELNGAPVRLRLGDEVTFKEQPYLGHRGEEITQEGYIHSFEVMEASDLFGHEKERGETKARCAYKKHMGYLSAGIALSDLTLVLQQPQHGSSQTGGAGNSSGTNGAVGKGKQPKGSPPSGRKGSSSAGAAAISTQSVQSWGQGRCEHVATGEEHNHKDGKCLSCHKASKRANGKSGSETGVNGGDDPMKPEVDETRKIGVEGSTAQCETPGCSNGHYQLGVCRSCFARHRERVAKIVSEKKAEQGHLAPVRACEGLLSESSHAECMRNANKWEGDSVDLDKSITGRCSLCGKVGGKGYKNQLLICDGFGCPFASHMGCLEPKLTQVPRGLWFCDQCVENKNKERSEVGCTACQSPFDDDKLLCCDGPGVDGTSCDALYHLGCLPVPLESPPDGKWFCPRCAHGGRSASCSSSSRGGSATRDDGTSYSGDDGGGGSGGGRGGRSNAHPGRRARPSPSSSSPPRGGGGEKRKRDGGDGGGSGGSGSGDGAVSRKRSVKDSRVRGCSSRQKRSGSSASSVSESPPPADRCANPDCGRLPAAGPLAGIKWTPCAPFTVNQGYGDGDSAGGKGVEVLARMESEEMRWRCGYAQCNGDNSNSSNNNSYHTRCLEARLVSVRTSGNAALRRAPKEHHAPGGQEAPSLLSPTPGIIDSGGENGPARSLYPKSDMTGEGGGRGPGEVGAEARKGNGALSEIVDLSMDDMEEVPAVPARVAGEAVVEKEDVVWKVEYACPACKGVLATQEVDPAMQQTLRYRVFESKLSECFWSEFGKPRSEVEDDRNMGIKGSKKTVAGKPDLMYGSIYEGVTDFIFRTCGLKSQDCFVDIGSGLGQIVTQAAAWAGCTSLGVEISQDHHKAAVRLWNKLKEMAAGTILDNKALAAVSLIEGDFLDKWDQLKGCTVIFLNNEGRWFKSKHPNMANSSHESKLVEFLQELDRSVTLVTTEGLHMFPQGWTHEEHTYRTPNGDERLATFRKASMKINLYKTNAGSWECKHCSLRHEKTVTECSCDRPPHLRSTTAGRGGSSTLA
eukprot:g11491.t1